MSYVVRQAAKKLCENVAGLESPDENIDGEYGAIAALANFEHINNKAKTAFNENGLTVKQGRDNAESFACDARSALKKVRTAARVVVSAQTTESDREDAGATISKALGAAEHAARAAIEAAESVLPAAEFVRNAMPALAQDPILRDTPIMAKAEADAAEVPGLVRQANDAAVAASKAALKAQDVATAAKHGLLLWEEADRSSEEQPERRGFLSTRPL